MAKGKIHKYIYYPGCIGLMNEWFLIHINEETYAILLRRHIKGLEIFDLNNSIIRNQNSSEFEREISIKGLLDFAVINHKEIPNFSLGFNISGEKRLIKDYYFTELLICKEVNDVYQPDLKPNELEDVLSEFILNYKLISKDVNIKMPSETNIPNFLDGLKYYEYSTDDLSLSINDRIKLDKQSTNFVNSHIDLDLNEMAKGIIPKHNAKDMGEKLKPFLLNNIFSESLHKIAISYDQIKLDKNLNMILLELFIYIETVIFKYLENKKLEAGVSKNKLDDYAADIGIGYMINIELQMHIPNMNTDIKQILGNLDKVRKLRNRVVHTNYKVSLKEIQEAVFSVDKFLRLMRNLSAVS